MVERLLSVAGAVEAGTAVSSLQGRAARRPSTALLSAAAAAQPPGRKALPVHNSIATTVLMHPVGRPPHPACPKSLLGGWCYPRKQW